MIEPRAMASAVFGIQDESGLPLDVSDGPVQPGNVRFWRLSAERLGNDRFPVDPERLNALRTQLAEAGFRIEAESPVGLSFSGTRATFEAAYGLDPFAYSGQSVALTEPEGSGGTGGSSGARTVFVPPGSSLPPFVLKASENPLRALELQPAAVPVSGGPSRRAFVQGVVAVAAVAGCPKPTTAPEAFEGVDGLRGLFGLTGTSLRGAGTLVAVVDSGFEGPGALERVFAVGDLEPTTDEIGHGTAVVEHLRAVAPDVEVRVSKYIDGTGYRNYPVAAFQRAVWGDWTSADPEAAVRLPDIVVCSWVMADLSVALQREIAMAVRNGVLVVFAAGNGRMQDAPASASKTPIVLSEGNPQPFANDPISRSMQLPTLYPVAHPDALVVGGAIAPVGGRATEASRVATSFESRLFGEADSLPSRAVPDVCGFVAPPPAFDSLEPPGSFLTRTSKGSDLDRKPDGTAVNDGQVRTAGTSMAAAHVAGMAALLAEHVRGRPGADAPLSPNAMRHVLMATAEDVAAGEGGGPEEGESGPGYDAETGYGLVSKRAFDWLVPGPFPFVRASVYDRGDVQVGTERRVVTVGNGQSSPDLVTESRRRDRFPSDDLQTRLGLASRHVSGIGIPAGDAVGAVFVRVSNRGDQAFEGPIRVYEITDGSSDKRQNPAEISVRVPAGAFEVVAIDLGFTLNPSAGLLVVIGEGLDSVPSLAELKDTVQSSVRCGAYFPGGES